MSVDIMIMVEANKKVAYKMTKEEKNRLKNVFDYDELKILRKKYNL